MPVILQKNEAANEPVDPSDLTEAELLSELTDANGELTLEGQIAVDFINSVDFSDIAEDADVEELGEVSEAWGIEQADGSFVEADEGDEGAVPVEVLTIPAQAAAMFVDEEDLCDMFSHYVHEEMSEDSTHDKALKQVGLQMITLDEKAPFKRGDFVKVGKSAAGRKLVNRMLGAMVAKGDISKAKAGNKKRYHAPGSQKGSETYTQAYAKAGGKPKHNLNKEELTTAQRTHQRWQAYKTKNAAKIKKSASKTISAKTTVNGKTKQGNAIKKAALQKAAKKDLAKQKAKKVQVKLKGGKGKGKSLGESTVNESVQPTYRTPTSARLGDMNESSAAAAACRALSGKRKADNALNG